MSAHVYGMIWIAYNAERLYVLSLVARKRQVDGAVYKLNSNHILLYIYLRMWFSESVLNADCTMEMLYQMDRIIRLHFLHRFVTFRLLMHYWAKQTKDDSSDPSDFFSFI